jgi:heptosyltransferase-1
LGDVVLASAVVDALRRAYPGVAIDFLSAAPAKALLETDPRLDGVFLLGDERATDGHVRIGSKPDAIRWMRRRRSDLMVDLFSNPLTALLSAFSGAHYRVGLARRWRAIAYNIRVPRFQGDPAHDFRYAREVQLDFLRNAGIRWQGDARAEVFLETADREFAGEALQTLGYRSGAPFAAVLPAGSWESKRWTAEGFAAVGRYLAERLGQPTLVVWGPPERQDAESIASSLGEKARLAPPTTLRQMAALLGQPTALVATDCLGRHLSVVQGVATVGIFSTTDPRSWTPREGTHRAVRGGPREGYATLRDLPPDPVIEQVQALLEDGVLDSPRPSF